MLQHYLKKKALPVTKKKLPVAIGLQQVCRQTYLILNSLINSLINDLIGVQPGAACGNSIIYHIDLLRIYYIIHDN